MARQRIQSPPNKINKINCLLQQGQKPLRKATDRKAGIALYCCSLHQEQVKNAPQGDHSYYRYGPYFKNKRMPERASSPQTVAIGQGVTGSN